MWLRDLASQLAVPRERTAAVGDSSGDVSMLETLALRFFVGMESPLEVTCVHIPRANILDLARDILAEWKLG
jgi:phosphoserine phosphatase